MGNPRLERTFDEGLVAMRKLRYNRAFDCFSAAMELDPEMPEVYYNRGIAASELSRWDDAEESFRMALRLHGHPAYRIHLGLTLLHRKQWQRAREEFEKALELEPESELARTHKNDLDFFLSRDEEERGVCPPLCILWFDPRLEDFVGVDPVIVAKKERGTLREYIRAEFDGVQTNGLDYEATVKARADADAAGGGGRAGAAGLNYAEAEEVATSLCYIASGLAQDGGLAWTGDPATSPQALPQPPPDGGWRYCPL